MIGVRLRAFAWWNWFAEHRLGLPAAFLILVMPLGLMLAVITPPGLVADEQAHVGRAEAVLHGWLVGERHAAVAADGHGFVEAGVYGDVAILLACFFPHEQVTATSYAFKRSMGWQGQNLFMQLTPLAIYFPAFYLPGSIGIEAARLAGAMPFQAIYAGRLTMLLAYCLLGLGALRVARRGAGLIFVTLSAPMALSLAASFNPDGLLIATTALGAALMSAGRWRGAALCIGLVTLVKPPYAPLLLMLMLPLAGMSRGTLLHRAGVVALAALPGALWFVAVMLTVSAPRQFVPPYHPGPLWTGDPAALFSVSDPVAQLRVILAQPLRYLDLLWTGIATNPNLRHEAIGVLGSLDLRLSPALYRIWEFAAVAALLADTLVARRPSWRDAALLTLGLATSVVLIWTSQYLNWDMVGAATIEGPTGRYLLPLIPVLGLAVPALGTRWLQPLRHGLLCLPFIAAGLTLILLPQLVAIHFYLG